MKLINIVPLLALVVVLGGQAAIGGLTVGFYKKQCPNVEKIVQNITWSHVQNDATLPPKLIRLFFHDCYTNGCDGSVLINSTASNIAEKDAPINLSLGGFDIIEEVKTAVESVCPGKVSCADILALSARDGVSFQFGKNLWEVQTGRRDTTVSQASVATGNLPSPLSNFATLVKEFKGKNLRVVDMVVLTGAHTFGIGHCNVFGQRVFNFTGNGDSDPSLDANYTSFLKTQCNGPNDAAGSVPLDPTTPQAFDSAYFSDLLQNKGLFTSDADFLKNNQSLALVNQFVDFNAFLTQFKLSIARMGAFQVMTGSNGVIRKQCSASS